VDLPVIGAMDRAFDRSRHDFLRAMDRCGVLDNAVTEQGPILHQAKHANVPPGYVIAGRG
jgi:hypothetical protein